MMKNYQRPFKAATIISAILTIILFSACSTPDKPKTSPDKPKTSFKLTVTSQNDATFDFCIISDEIEGNRKDYKGQTTPFEMDIEMSNFKLLLKKVSGESSVKFKVSDEMGSIEGNWPTTVILVTPESHQTFGL